MDCSNDWPMNQKRGYQKMVPLVGCNSAGLACAKRQQTCSFLVLYYPICGNPFTEVLVHISRRKTKQPFTSSEEQIRNIFLQVRQANYIYIGLPDKVALMYSLCVYIYKWSKSTQIEVIMCDRSSCEVSTYKQWTGCRQGAKCPGTATRQSVSIKLRYGLVQA